MCIRRSSVEANQSPEVFQSILQTFIRGVQEAIENPHQFKPHHIAIRQPFDYYKW